MSRPGLTTAEARRALRARYAGEPFVTVHDAARCRRPREVRGTNRAHIGVAVDERTGTLVAACAIDNLGQGHGGPGGPVRERRARVSRDRGLRRARSRWSSGPRSPGCRRSHRRDADSRRIALIASRAASSRRAGFLAAGVSAGIKKTASATSRSSPPRRAGAGRRGLHHQHGGRRAGASSRASTSRRACARRRRQRRQRERLHRRRRACADARAMAARPRPSCSGATPHEVVVASTGVIGVPLPIDAGRRGHRRGGRRARQPTAATTPPRRS